MQSGAKSWWGKIKKSVVPGVGQQLLQPQLPRWCRRWGTSSGRTTVRRKLSWSAQFYLPKSTLDPVSSDIALQPVTLHHPFDLCCLILITWHHQKTERKIETLARWITRRHSRVWRSNDASSTTLVLRLIRESQTNWRGNRSPPTTAPHYVLPRGPSATMLRSLRCF